MSSEDVAEVVQMLIGARASVNHACAGRTPLMIAALDSKASVVGALLVGRADPTLRSPTGKTAFELAELKFGVVPELLCGLR